MIMENISYCIRGLLRVCLLSVLFTSCSLFNSFTECEKSADCGSNAICTEGGLCLEVNLQIDECIGGPLSVMVGASCRAQLIEDQNTSPDGIGGCFFIQADGYRPAATSFSWREGELRLNAVQPTLVNGVAFNTHLYFMRVISSEGVDCNELLTTLSMPCSMIQGCVVKLTSPPQVYDRNEELNVSYLNENEECGVTLNQSLLPVESLDVVDNDCDGKVDEDQQRCVVGEGLCRNEGEYVTSATGGRLCNVEAIPPQDERCDTLKDEDCDGIVDEGFEMLGQPCSVVVDGETQGGLYRCAFNQLSLECDTRALDPCDGIDSDLDGVVDENHELIEVGCPAGSCSATGYELCVNGAVTNTCTQGMMSASDDLCDGYDNDCDGLLDEDATPVSIRCGEFTCEREGELRCELGREVQLCTPGVPQDELCDQRDNDCDGRSDENVPGCGVQCTDEVCDQIDNDCDGQIDEGLLNGCGTCGPAPVEVVCDNLDNDCDGLFDEGELPTERCDPNDNDCDGSIDEQLPGCDSSVLSSCSITFTWTNADRSASRALVIGDSFVPLTPNWSTSLDSDDEPYLPKRGEHLSLDMNCVNDQSWGTWINEHCALSFVLSERFGQAEFSSDRLDPVACTESGSPIPNRCISSAIPGSLTLESNYSNFGLHFSCPVGQAGTARDQAIAAHLESLFTYKLFKSNENSSNDCESPMVPCAGCQEERAGSTYYVEDANNCDALYFGVELLNR